MLNLTEQLILISIQCQVIFAHESEIKLVVGIFVFDDVHLNSTMMQAIFISMRIFYGLSCSVSR